MQETNIRVLKQIRAELMERITALDSVISLLEHLDDGIVDEPYVAPVVETPTTKKGKTRNTTFESNFDFAQPPSPWICPKCGAMNSIDRKICVECKTKKPET